MDPSGLLPAIKLMLDIKKTIDTTTLTRRVDKISTTVDAIGRHLAQSDIADLQSGFSHLDTAMKVSAGQLRNDELVAARQSFNRLAQRSSAGGSLDAFSDISATHVAAMGHLGNMYYFLLRDAPNRALVSAYACTETFPALGVHVLPAALFARDWRPLAAIHSTPESVMRSYRDAANQHQSARRAYGIDMLWRVPAAAGAVLAGLVGATASPSLAGHGVQWATGILSTTEQGLVPPQPPDRRHYLRLASQLQHQLEPVIADARERRIAAEQLPVP